MKKQIVLMDRPRMERTLKPDGDSGMGTDQ